MTNCIYPYGIPLLGVAQGTDASWKYYCKTKEQTRLSRSIFIRESLRCLEELAFDNCTNMTGERFILSSTFTLTSPNRKMSTSQFLFCSGRDTNNQPMYKRKNALQTQSKANPQMLRVQYCVNFDANSLWQDTCPFLTFFLGTTLKLARGIISISRGGS